MKARWIIIARLSVLLLIIVCVIMEPTINGWLVYSPTPERSSIFIRNYSPQEVINSFVPENYKGHGTGDNTAWAGFRFGRAPRSPRRELWMEQYLIVQTEKCEPLVIALRDDIVSKLSHDGAKILSNSGNASSGFHLDYIIGKNVGSATIALVAKRELLHYTDGRIEYRPLPTGMQGVATNIRISEKWFPKDSDAIRASLQVPQSQSDNHE
jgi:hypothetical protein